MHIVEYKPENYKEKSEKYDLIFQKSTGRKCNITTGRPGDRETGRPGDREKEVKTVSLCDTGRADRSDGTSSTKMAPIRIGLENLTRFIFERPSDILEKMSSRLLYFQLLLG